MSGAVAVKGVFGGLRFHKKRSPIHSLDPRIKFIFLCSVFIAAIIFNEAIPLAALFVMIIPFVFMAKIQKQWFGSLRATGFMALLIFSLNLLTNFLVSNYTITGASIEGATAMALRFLVLVETFSLFFLTTSPDLVGLALEQSHFPYAFAFAFTTAVRFVPVLAIESQTITDAQKARGLELEKGGYIKKIKNYVPVIIPLVVSAIRRSLELAEAMEARAWGFAEKRSHLYLLKLHRNDFTLLAISIGILAGSIFISFYVQVPSINQLLQIFF
jgi:energy-coupling factor transport system permease protein